MKTRNVILIIAVMLALVVPAMAVSCAKPTANFVSTTPTGVGHVTVKFYDNSLGNPTSWEWSWIPTGRPEVGWQLFSREKNPTFTFGYTNNLGIMPGYSSIMLKVKNAAGSSSVMKYGYVVVSPEQKPIASFTATPTRGRNYATVHFTDTSKNNPTSWKWEWQPTGRPEVGWTTFSTEQNPTKVFHYTNNLGIYPGYSSVQLTATNAAGKSTVTKTGLIQVYKR